MSKEITLAEISRATERICFHLGLEDERTQAAIELVLEVLSVDNDRLPGLTVMETKFVKVLRAARGAIIGKEALCEMVSPGRQPKLMDVMKCKVMQKPGYEGCIETVWGVGYRWAGEGARRDAA